jgi:hypothetical protein
MWNCRRVKTMNNKMTQLANQLSNNDKLEGEIKKNLAGLGYEF